MNSIRRPRWGPITLLATLALALAPPLLASNTAPPAVQSVTSPVSLQAAPAVFFDGNAYEAFITHQSAPVAADCVLLVAPAALTIQPGAIDALPHFRCSMSLRCTGSSFGLSNYVTSITGTGNSRKEVARMGATLAFGSQFN
jgi:hypothetical protein